MKTCVVSCFAVLLLSGVSLGAAEPVVVVAGSSIADAQQPQAAVDEAGTIYIAFGADEAIYCCTSTDVGKTWSKPVKIGELPKLALGMRRGPRIAAGHGAVVVTAISHDNGNVFVWHSGDQGQSWQGPLQVNDSPKDAREGLHAMAMGPGGEVFCTWLDLRNQGTRLFGATSMDGGKTWSENREIYRSPDGSICECCHPAVTYDAEGALYVMWRNSVGGYRDLYLATSRDGGKTFSEGTKLGTGSWQLDACPMDGGYLAAAAAGEVTTVWRRDEQVFRTDSNHQRERLIGAGEQPWAVAGADGVYLVWLTRRNGDLWLTTPAAPKPRQLSSNAVDPALAAPVIGEGPVVAVWQTGKHGDTSILAMVVGG